MLSSVIPAMRCRQCQEVTPADDLCCWAPVCLSCGSKYLEVVHTEDLERAAVADKRLLRVMALLTLAVPGIPLAVWLASKVAA